MQQYQNRFAVAPIMPSKKKKKGKRGGGGGAPRPQQPQQPEPVMDVSAATAELASNAAKMAELQEQAAAFKKLIEQVRPASAPATPAPARAAPAAAAASGVAADSPDKSSMKQNTSLMTQQMMRRVEALAAQHAHVRRETLGIPAPAPAPAPTPASAPRPKPAAKAPKPAKAAPKTAAEEAKEWHEKAAGLATSDKWQEAAEAWEAATGLDPMNSEYWYYRGITAQRMELPLDAEKWWKKATNLGHEKSKGILAVMKQKRGQEARQKADALLQQDKFEKAIGMYQAAINICPSEAEHAANCYNGKGVAYGLKGDWESARTEWNKAVELMPSAPAFIHYRGVASLKLKRFGEAAADLRTSHGLGHERSQQQLEECERQEQVARCVESPQAHIIR